MTQKTLFIPKILKNIPLAWVLVIPFVLQIVGAVGLVGYLSYRVCQKSTEEMANRLMVEIGDRVDQHLDSFLGNAQNINHLNLDLELSQISRFLKNLKISESGTVFIVDRTGLMVASSANESPAPVVNGKAQRLAAVNSNTPLIRDITQDLMDRFGNLQQVKNSQFLRPSLPQNPFVKVTPYGQGKGLDWLVVTVIPESEFMADIQANINRTVLLCGITLLLAIASGLWTTRLIVRPIRRLSQASSALAQGEWQENLSEENAIAELQTLSISFNQMAMQMRQSFEQVEGELQDSREMYQRVVQSQTDFILRSQPDTTITFANPALCKALGTSLEKVIGQKWIDFADPNDLQAILQQISQLSPENPSFIAENKDQRANGQIGWTQWIDQGIFNEEGQLIEIQSVGRDITELKQTEAKLLENQRFIEKITEATPSLLYIYDHIEEKNIYANRSVPEILGYSYVEIQAMGSDLFAKICHPEDFPKLYAAVQKLRNLETDEIVETEYRVRDAQGEWHWLMSRDLVFSRTEDGQVWQTLGTSQDISDRKQAEIEIHRTQTFLDSIIENIPNMVFVKDAVDLKFVRLNKAAEDLLGYAKEDLLGKSDYDFFPSEEANFFMFKDREVLAKGEVMDIPEEKIHTNTQGIRILHTKKIPILNESNQPEYLLGISEDITERIQLENRLTRLARHIPGMIYQFRMRADGTSHFPYASEGIRDIYGVAPLEVREDASAIFAVLHPDDLERIGQSIQDSATNLSPWHCEYRVHFADGRMIWVLGYATPQREADGSTIWHGYITDISDRKQAEFLLISEKERAEEAELKLQKTQIILERTNQKLLKLIDTDPLTKIANRRCFNIRVRQEWKRLFREQKFLSLILIDVDYFKYYNDRYGHPQGDRCLIQIAQTAKQTIGRSTDLVARIGGEEFAVILPNTDLEGAKVAAEKIRLAIQSLAIPHQDSQVNDKVTISLGIMSLIPTTGQSPTTLINQADQALFQAKKQGRNQSVIFCEILGYNENR